MRVQLGTAKPHAHLVGHDEPCVTYWSDQGTCEHVAEGRPNGKDALLHVLSGYGGVTHLPGNDGFVSVVNAWQTHSAEPPAWVWSDNADLAVMLSEAYGCPIGVPEDVEDTHHTLAGPPGVGPNATEG